MGKIAIIYSDNDAIIMQLKSESEYCKNIVDGLKNNKNKLQNETIKITKYFKG